MNYILENAQLYKNGKLSSHDIMISKGTFFPVPSTGSTADGSAPVKLNNCLIIPGFLDVHVHLREPGFFYKETIKSGSLAAARGGYTGICSMPNLNPCPDTAAHLQVQLDIIKESAQVKVYPYGTITMCQEGTELSEMEAMAEQVIAFSDDGRGVQMDEMMRRAMSEAARLGKIIAAHCEDNSLLGNGYIHAGEYAKKHGHRGISSESEWKQLERDLRLVAETGCDYHVCHVSTRESVELIRRAKAEGLPVTCETAPHYLVLCDMDIKEDGRFKMNPPLRAAADRDALLCGICDGTIDMIATDHAPHSYEEKSRGLEKSLMGVSGLECAFPVLYTCLVKKGILPLEKLLALMITNPRKRFKINEAPDTFSVIDLKKEYQINADDFLSKGKSTPFERMDVLSQCIMTIINGRTVWQENLTEKQEGRAHEQRTL